MTRQKYCNMIFVEGVDYVYVYKPAALLHSTILKKTVFTVLCKTTFLSIRYVFPCYSEMPLLPNLDNCI